jgi:hypothetical protein
VPDGADDDAALVERRPGGGLDAVEVEEVERFVQVFDHVVEHGVEREDVLAVERRHVLRVEQLDDVASDVVALVLDVLDVRLPDGRVRILGETPLDQALPRARWLPPW